MIEKKDFEYIYQLFNGVTPLLGDCGELCAKGCCTDWEEGVGMYLLPGEEVMFRGNEDWLVFERHSVEEYEFPSSWQGEYYFVRCQGKCPREKRPFECRTFPLIPYYHQKTEEYELILNPDGLMICPLVKFSDIDDLDPVFVERVEEAWSILLEDPLIAEDIRHKSRIWDQDPPWKKFFSE